MSYIRESVGCFCVMPFRKKIIIIYSRDGAGSDSPHVVACNDNIRCIRKYLSYDSRKSIVQAIIMSRLDYGQ